MSISKQPARLGLVLLELLAVLSILMLLAAILIPMFIRAREQSTRFRCQNQLREIGLAILAYRDEHKGRFPAPSSTRPTTEPARITAHREDASPAPELDPDSVPAAIFLLMRTHDLSPSLFVCPATDAIPDNLSNPPFETRSTFSSIRQNLSYSMQAPAENRPRPKAGVTWSPLAKPNLVIMADINPGIRGKDDHVLAITPNFPAGNMRWGNSNNHGKRGQNVLYADGRVEFADNPFVGIRRDNIYTTQKNTILDFPAHPDDTILLPTDD